MIGVIDSSDSVIPLLPYLLLVAVEIVTVGK